MTDYTSQIATLRDLAKRHSGISRERYEQAADAIETLIGKVKYLIERCDMADKNCAESVHLGALWKEAALEQKPRWIPVTERLPEEAKEVLALDNNGDFCIAWVIEFVGSKGTYSEWACADGWSDTQLPITHWMPLPEPPKEGT